MDVFHMTYVRNATFHKLKKNSKKVILEEKLEEYLCETLCSEQFLPNFGIMLYYCRPTMNFYKKLY